MYLFSEEDFISRNSGFGLGDISEDDDAKQLDNDNSLAM